MQISGLTTATPQNSVLVTLMPLSVQARSKPQAVESGTDYAPTQVSGASAGGSATVAPAAAPAPAATHTARAGGGAVSSASLVDTVAPVYSTTVGGVQYSGSVEESGNEYSVSIPNLPDATASGSSIISAENNLTMRIDELV
jgi:hypothetical protein